MHVLLVNRSPMICVRFEHTKASEEFVFHPQAALLYVRYVLVYLMLKHTRGFAYNLYP